MGLMQGETDWILLMMSGEGGNCKGGGRNDCSISFKGWLRVLRKECLDPVNFRRRRVFQRSDKLKNRNEKVGGQPKK